MIIRSIILLKRLALLPGGVQVTGKPVRVHGRLDL